MRLLFVISATLWAWLVGRVIAFGPNTRSLCWHPNMHASTWYRLTPNPYNIPHKYFPFLSIAFALLAVPSLFIDDDTIHILTVIRLVSEHAYLPLFTAHVHSQTLLTLWPLANICAATACIYLQTLDNTFWYTMSIPATTFALVLHIWFAAIQTYLVCKQPIVRREQEYQERQPRIV